jgi:hypothetical protein
LTLDIEGLFLAFAYNFFIHPEAFCALWNQGRMISQGQVLIIGEFVWIPSPGREGGEPKLQETLKLLSKYSGI